MRAAVGVGALVVLLLAAGCGDDGGTATTTTAPTTTTVPAPPTTGAPSTTAVPGPPRALPADGLEVLVLGDSVMFDAAAAVEAALDATGAATTRANAVLGFGLSSSAAVPFAGAADDLLTGPPPDQVVLMVGSWDHRAALRDPEAYATEVAAALDRLTRDGTQVLVLGEPPSDPAKGEEEGRTAVNAVLAAAAAERGDVTFLATDEVIGDAQGRYVRTEGGELLRKPDGRHLCPAGAERFGTAVIGALQATWALPASAAGWQDGPWRQEPRYDDPPGACPS